MWDSFNAVIEYCVKKCIPKRTKSYVNKPKWMTKAALKAAKKYFFWKRYRVSRTYADYCTYKHSLNYYFKKAKEAQKSFEVKLAKNIKHDVNPFMRTLVQN